MRLVAFSPAYASGRIKRTVIRKAKVSSISGISLALRTTNGERIPSRTLTIVAIPMCNNRITPLTLRQVGRLRTSNTPTIIIIICNGQTCRGTLIRLSTFIAGLNFGMVTNTAFMKRRSCDYRGCPITSKHPSTSSLRCTGLFNRGVHTGVTTTRSVRGLCKISIAHVRHPHRPFFPLLHFLHEIIGLHGDKIPVPHAPRISTRHYARYKCYIGRYPTKTVVGKSRYGAITRGYVGYYTYIGNYPRGTHACSAPFTMLLSSYFGGRGRSEVVL